jgi:L-threonylcarbamoyladenylate synthase
MTPFQTRVLTIDSPALFAAAVAEAAAILRAGGLVALPTETVYGLAANAFDARAVAAIFTAKGRPAHNPVIVHVDGLPLARECVADWPARAERLARAFWPGPLTLVLPKSGRVPAVVSAGGDTVGLRQPSHPFMAAVIRACGFPLAAPSANLSNQISPTCAAHVVKDLQGAIPLIVDGGDCPVGIESTVLDLAQHPPRILRPGIVHEESLRALVPDLAQPGGLAAAGGGLRSPGMLRRHYSPRARLVVLAWSTEAELEAGWQQLGRVTPADVHILAYQAVPLGGDWGRVCVVPHDPLAYARALYAELHRCDELGARLILVEAPPADSAWSGIRDRLARAAAQ